MTLEFDSLFEKSLYRAKSQESCLLTHFCIPSPSSLHCSEDLENATDRSNAIASSLATVISKSFGARNTTNASVLDRCPSFVTKEKSSSSSKVICFVFKVLCCPLSPGCTTKMRVLGCVIFLRSWERAHATTDMPF